MLSARTCIELAYVIESLITAEVDRIFYVFGLKYLITPNDGGMSKAKKINHIIGKLSAPELPGPFGITFQIDLLQYVVDNYYRKKTGEQKQERLLVNRSGSPTPFEDLFAEEYQQLSNSLKRDGFIVKGTTVRKLFPLEIEEAKTETELDLLLERFSFTQTKGHLDQARTNHSQGNWAGANAQFRTFTESLLIEIAVLKLPGNPCASATAAINLLTNTVSPPFLKSELNEVENTHCKKPFIEGLWKRLHPDGNHPGLSNEEDCSFRYHTLIVFARYLLKRLEKES